MSTNTRITSRGGAVRALAIVALMAVLAAACGGGADPAETETAASEVAEPTQIAIATTAPLTVDDSATTTGETAEAIPTVDPCTFDPENCDAEAAGEAIDPNETTVLVVKEANALEIPVFDAPNGTDTRLLDINPINGVETPYPLNATTYYGNPLALMVKQFDSSGNWAEVYMPVRPNNTTAWVQTGFFNVEKHDYRITIDLSDNYVALFKGDELIVESITVDGRPERPTPVVRSYIDEKIRGESLAPAYGAWVLSIAAFSEELSDFGGGMPKLALHGTNQPDLMGEDVSSGCVRVPDEIINQIAEIAPLGTPVDIVA